MHIAQEQSLHFFYDKGFGITKTKQSVRHFHCDIGNITVEYKVISSKISIFFLDVVTVFFLAVSVTGLFLTRLKASICCQFTHFQFHFE